MPLAMFRMAPGEGLEYRLHLAGTGTVLALEVRRPQEGRSAELELSLYGDDRRALGCGRVTIDGGYLAVVRETRRQVKRSGVLSGGEEVEFDLVRVSGSPQSGRADTLFGRERGP